MPVYLSLMCWRPAVIRPHSVSDSAQKVNNGLHLESIGSEEKVGANDVTALPFSGGSVEETLEPNNAKQTTQKDADRKNGEIGIQNDAVAIDDEKDVGENKQDNTIVNVPELNEDKVKRKNGEELAQGALGKTETNTNDGAANPVPVKKLEQSTPVDNSNEDTAHASQHTDKEEPVANKNTEQHPAPRVHLQNVPQVTLVGIKQL